MRRFPAALAALLLLTACAPSPGPQPAEPVPAPEASAPAEDAPLFPVYTDWSKLTPYASQGPLYTYFDPYSADGTLQPQADYGPLLIYIGTNAAVGNYIVDRLPLYGLVTAQGALVTEPVYADIYFAGGFLVLVRGEVYGYRETEWGPEPEGSFTYTVAAGDGSWVRELGACYGLFTLPGGRLAVSLMDGSALVLDPDGSTAAEFPRSVLEPWLGADYHWSWDMGPNLVDWEGTLAVWQWDDAAQQESLCWLDPATGAVSTDRPADTGGYEPEDGLYRSIPELEGYSYLDPIRDSVTGQVYYYGSRWEEDDLIYDLMDRDCRVVMPDCQMQDVYVWVPYIRAGLASSIQDGVFCYTALADGTTVFRYPLRTNSD